ncbi:ankyrin repeat-containing domain protein [Tribonema minus]|uniref:Ankyrin repeat-containing domain protein n=1 Tax=Tribonema minus TaxID=303371 RepID=A0A835YRJ6_9STRA|nr:ankyrin repeat-containing domain protein [Tribonema minus]
MFNFLFQGNLGDIIAPIQSPEQQLLIAIQNRQMDKAKAMVCMYACLRNTAVDSGVTPVHMACQAGLQELLRRLAELGGDLAGADNSGNTPLHYAAKGGQIDTVKWLLELGARVDARNASRQSPYDLATNHVVRQYLLPLQLKAEASNPSSAAASPYDYPGAQAQQQQQYAAPLPPPSAALEALMQVGVCC